MSERETVVELPFAADWGLPFGNAYPRVAHTPRAIARGRQRARPRRYHAARSTAHDGCA